MKILVVSSTPWNNQNSFGNSYSNIFSGIPNMEFANIYCSSGSPDNEFDMKCYQVTFEMLLKNLKNKKNKPYKKVENNSDKGIERNESEQKTFDKARTLRFQVLFWVRDFIWKIGRWKTEALKKFINDFSPDIIFVPIYFSSYMNDIIQFVKKYTGLPMIGYISDDCYTLKQMRLSPLYWIDRLWKRTKVKKTVNMCELLYVISDIQKAEYEKIFKPECKILTKCADFDAELPAYEKNHDGIRLIYAGNIGSGRFKSLKFIIDAVKRLNDEGKKVNFDIYTSTPLTKKMKRVLLGSNGTKTHGAVPYSEIIKLQREADMLVHVEGLSLKSRLAVRQSFSTKLVDFFEMGKCILAVGKDDVASIKHLKDNNVGLICDSEQAIYNALKNATENPDILVEMGKNAYICGKNYHNKTEIQKMLISDIKSISNNK